MISWKSMASLLMLCIGYTQVSATDETPLKAALPQLSPWSYTESNHPTGIIPEILNEIAEELKVPIAISIVPYPRMIQMHALGETDLSVSFQPVDDFEFGEHITDIYPLSTVILAKKGLVQLHTDPADPLIIATLRGALYNKDISERLLYRAIETNDHEHSIRLVLAGRADGLAGPQDQLEFLLDQRLDKSQTFEIIEKIGADTVWLAIATKGEGYHQKKTIKAATNKLSQEGTITFIVEKHLAEWGYLYPD